MNHHPNKQKTDLETRRYQRLVAVAMFLLLVAVGVASRFWLVELPNFKPVAALVLFGGFFFRKAWIAIAALMVIMVVTDLRLGLYQWQLALSVYASLGLACGLGVWVKRSLESNQTNGLLVKIGNRQIGKFVVASLTMSTVFFLLTNGAVWCGGVWYPRTAEGLMDCYAAAIPFFRSTLCGDLFFTGAVVSGYCLLEKLVSRTVYFKDAQENAHA